MRSPSTCGQLQLCSALAEIPMCCRRVIGGTATSAWPKFNSLRCRPRHVLNWQVKWHVRFQHQRQWDWLEWGRHCFVPFFLPFNELEDYKRRCLCGRGFTCVGLSTWQCLRSTLCSRLSLLRRWKVSFSNQNKFYTRDFRERRRSEVEHTPSQVPIISKLDEVEDTVFLEDSFTDTEKKRDKKVSE